jgi:hypothetical protein
MLNLTTPQTVQNITRIKVLSFTVDTSGSIAIRLQFRPPPGGQPEEIQALQAYGGTQTVVVADAPASSETIGFATSGVENPYTSLLVRGQAFVASGYTHCIDAIRGANNANAMLTALENSLSADGIIPPGT